MNPLLDALSTASYALDTPGALLRGALSGKLGERASGQDLLSSYGLSSQDDPWGGVKGFAAEAVLDPLALAGPALGAFKGLQGIHRGTKALGALSHADDANPIARAVAGFTGGEEGAISLPRAMELIRTPENPLGRFNTLAEHSPAKVSTAPVYQDLRFGHLHGSPGDMAVYERDPAGLLKEMGMNPETFGATGEPKMFPNLRHDEWGDPELMEELIRRNVKSNFGTGPVGVDSTPVHEVGHAFHDQALKTAFPENPDAFENLVGDWRSPLTMTSGPTMVPDITRHLGRYALTNPREFVAEAFTNQMLRGEPLSPQLRSLYEDLHGPDLDKLPPEFLRAWWNLPKL